MKNLEIDRENTMITKENLKAPSVCECINMRRASQALTQFYDKLLKPSGLKVTQYSLLSHLKRLGPLTMNELSQAIRLERTTLVRNLKPLEKMGLVSMTVEESSQARLVHHRARPGFSCCCGSLLGTGSAKGRRNVYPGRVRCV